MGNPELVFRKAKKTDCHKIAELALIAGEGFPAYFWGQSAKDGQDILEVAGVFETEFEFGVSLEKPGNYPALVRIDFTDAKQYPFSFLSLNHFSYKEEVSPKVFAMMKAQEIAKKGKIHLRLKNLDEEAKEANVRLILPKEISASNPVNGLFLEKS